MFAEVPGEGKAGARTPMRFPQRRLSVVTEAGFTPAEVLGEGKAGARTPVKERGNA